MGDKVLAVAGAAVGAFIGGPAGASIGFSIGSLAGQALFPHKLDGPRTRNLTSMNGAYGAMLPIVQGSARVPGSLIRSLPIQEVGTSQGGKGGPSVTTYAYYGSFAVALCEGPITAIRKIWANKILIYDVSSTANGGTISNSNQFAANYMTVYKGDAAQNPDPTLQGYFGAANVAAYRGTAYIMFRSLPLANYGNLLPTIEAEVITVAAVTSPLAKLWENDSTGFPMYSGSYPPPPSAVAGIPSGIVGGQLRIYNRNVSGGTIGGDGNTYILAVSDGSVQSPLTPNSFESAIETSDQVGTPKFNDGGASGGSSMGLIMPHAAGNCGVYSLGVGTHPDILTGPTRSGTLGASHPAMWVEDYATGTRQTDVIAALSTPPGLTGTWQLYAVFPCADWQHVCAVTFDAGNSNAWLHVLSVSSIFVVAEIARYQFSPASGASAINHVAGFFNTNGYAALANWDVAILESNLTTIWVGNGGSANLVSRYVVSGSQVPAPQTIAAFTTTPGANMGIFADGGTCFVTDFSRYGLFSISSSAGQIALSDVVSAICQRVGLQAGQLDVTALTDQVWGFVIDRQMTARAALEALAPAWWFDAVESDAKLKFVHRSGTSLITIPLDDMVVDPHSANTNPLQFTRGSEMELPSQINLSYYSVGADYQPGIQYWRRLTGLESNNVQSIDVAAVMDDTQAAIAAAVIGWDMVAGRTPFKFATSYKYAQYEPTDIWTIQTANAAYLARCTLKTENAGKIDWEFVACAPVYSQPATGGPITAGQIVSGATPTTAIIMDIPPLRDSDAAGDNLYVAMYGATGWPGAALYKSSDGGVTYAAGIAMGTMSTVGRATTALGAWTGGNTFDEANIVNVTILSGQTLASAAELTVLNGGNVALLGNEIIQFKNAVLVSGTTYKLSGFLRGRFGTEIPESTHGVGESFVLLSSPGVISLQGAPTSDIGQARIYDAVTTGQTLPSGQQQTITEHANTLVCFSPVLLTATNNGLAGDISLRWTRRDRKTWQWLPSVDVPMSEASEAYTVSIYSGSSVVRTISVSGSGVQSATYTSAQQTTDFGAAIGASGSLTWGVQQVSAVTGAGVMAKVTSNMPSAPGVAIFGNLLLHFDDGNGSTAFTDVYSHTFTANASAAESTAQAKFGSGSLAITGASGQCITTPDATDIRFTSGDFTIEFWLYFTDVNPFVYRGVMGKCSGGAQGAAPSNAKGAFMFFNDINTSIVHVRSSTSGTAWDVDISSAALGTGGWHAVAYTRHGTTFTLWIDGVSAGTAIVSGALTEDATALAIGADHTGDAGSVLHGYIDEVRITKGTARYTSNYTPIGPFGY